MKKIIVTAATVAFMGGVVNARAETKRFPLEDSTAGQQAIHLKVGGFLEQFAFSSSQGEATARSMGTGSARGPVALRPGSDPTVHQRCLG